MVTSDYETEFKGELSEVSDEIGIPHNLSAPTTPK